MENTLENKAKFFGQYFGFNCLRHQEIPNVSALPIMNPWHPGLEMEYLELTPISQISDIDAEYCIGLEYQMRRNDPNSCDYELSPSEIFIRHTKFLPSVYLGQIEFDYLRSKGYALPWMGLSVEELINRGWVKLKDVVSQEGVVRLETLNIGDHYKYNPKDIGIYKVLSKTDPNWVDVVRIQSGRRTGSFPWDEVYPIKEVLNGIKK